MKETILIIFGAIGFMVSAYILYSKKFDKPLYCPIGENCDNVVKSKYGKTFGIDNTIPGMGFYLLIIIYGIMLLLNRNLFKETVIHYVIVGISVGSVLFSLYLVYVQKFILKEWCIYCIVSAVSSILILGVLVL